MATTKFDDEDFESFQILDHEDVLEELPSSGSGSGSGSGSESHTPPLDKTVKEAPADSTNVSAAAAAAENEEATPVAVCSGIEVDTAGSDDHGHGHGEVSNEAKVTTSVSVETDSEKDVNPLDLELERIKEENVAFKREIEAMEAKVQEVESMGVVAIEKIKVEMEENKAVMEQSCLQVYQLTKENEALKTQIETNKLRMSELETHLNATCEELATRKRNQGKYVKKEKMEIQLRFKDDQLEVAKKQLTELDELYRSEQNQTIELKEKLRIAESKPISSSGDAQLFSFNVNDILALQQELTDAKADLEGQNKELEQLQRELNSHRSSLENSDKERTFLAHITMFLGGLLVLSLFWISRSSHTQD